MNDVNEWLDRRRWVVDGGRKVLLPKANDDRKLLVAVDKVLELHRPVEVEPSDTICWECSNRIGSGANMRFMPVAEWPCETVRAIEGAANE